MGPRARIETHIPDPATELVITGPPLQHRWRRRESNYEGTLIARNLLILQYGKTAKNARNAEVRYTAGTRAIGCGDLQPFERILVLPFRRELIHAAA